MVRNYIRKTHRKAWRADAMKVAIESVIKQGCSIRRASIENKVPHSTLSRKIHQIRSDPKKEIEIIADPKFESAHQRVFSREQEEKLCHYINRLENQMIRLSGTDIRSLAYQLAERFSIPHRFNKDIEAAGEDWYRGFLKRNEVLINKPDSSINKSQKLNKNKVSKFFDILETTVNKYQLEASDIYNLDETVITCSSKSNVEFSTTENDETKTHITTTQNKLVTAVISFSACGIYIPLMLIFPCKTKCKMLLKGAPPSSWAEFDLTGQMELNIFINWLKKFIKFTKVTKDSPILLLINGYETYLKNLKVIELTEENGIHILCVPPYCNNKLQPIQYSFMKTLSSAYTDEVKKCLKNNPENTVSIENVYQLFGIAFMKVSTVRTPVDSFRNTGIWPVDRGLFENNSTSISDNENLITNENITDSQLSSVISELEDEKSFEDLIENNEVINKSEDAIQDQSQTYAVETAEIINEQKYEEIIQQPFTLEPLLQEHCQQQYQIVQQQINQQMQLGEVNNVSLHNQSIQNENPNFPSCPIVIPAEAQLSEVLIEDLPNLIQSQRKLYFYASPFQLNLSKKSSVFLTHI